MDRLATVAIFGGAAWIVELAAMSAGVALGRCLTVCGILSPHVIEGSMLHFHGALITDKRCHFLSLTRRINRSTVFFSKWCLSAIA